MATVFIKSKSDNDIKALRYFALRLGMSVSPITNEEAEDAALYSLIKEGMKSKNVSRATIMKNLGKK